MNLVLEVVLWSIAITLISQGIGLAVMMLLGLSPRHLAHVIEDEQNPAVGAVFFIISLITAIYISTVAGDGYNPAESAAEDLAWMLGGALLAAGMTLISFRVAYQAMSPIQGESMYRYIRRELMEEQNVSLAFFLGGLAVAPFMATLQQIL